VLKTTSDENRLFWESTNKSLFSSFTELITLPSYIRCVSIQISFNISVRIVCFKYMTLNFFFQIFHFFTDILRGFSYNDQAAEFMWFGYSAFSGCSNTFKSEESPRWVCEFRDLGVLYS
jgi:hypothetical protein